MKINITYIEQDEYLPITGATRWNIYLRDAVYLEGFKHKPIINISKMIKLASA